MHLAASSGTGYPNVSELHGQVATLVLTLVQIVIGENRGITYAVDPLSVWLVESVDTCIDNLRHTSSVEPH